MYYLTITIPNDLQELATAIGYGHGNDGLVEEPFGRDVKLTFYFSQRRNAENAAASFSELLSIDAPPVEFIEDRQDWIAKWRESMEPAEIASGVWVSPVWLEPPSDGRKAWIKIEPKMAFGTGHHETTRLAAREIIARQKFIAGKDVIDIGTGSGVLCFVAGYSGAKNILGVEIDGDCRENLAENQRDNPAHTDGRINFMIGTTDALNPDKKFDAVIMNMLLTESEPILEQVSMLSKNESLLIWSGILIDEKDEAISAAERVGFRLSSERTENEWWCGTFCR